MSGSSAAPGGSSIAISGVGVGPSGDEPGGGGGGPQPTTTQARIAASRAAPVRLIQLDRVALREQGALILVMLHVLS
jgi:hypothetical protein